MNWRWFVGIPATIVVAGVAGSLLPEGSVGIAAALGVPIGTVGFWLTALWVEQ